LKTTKQINCAHRLARTYGLLPGKQAVFSIGHDLGLEAALDLFDLGLEVLCVADIREDGQDPALLEELAERNIPFLRGWVATHAHGKKTLRPAGRFSRDDAFNRPALSGPDKTGL
jgi:sarcosine oxidase subunit alpha